MASSKKLLLVYFFFLSCINCIAGEILQFDHYNTRNGLGSDYITSISQDRYGFIWIASTNSLDRFDGSSFKRMYNLRLQDTKSIVFNYKDSIMFYSTKGQIQSYSKPNAIMEEKTFDWIIENNYVKPVTKMTIQPDGRLYLCTTGGVVGYDEKTKKFCTIPGLTDSTQKNNIYAMSLLVDHDKNYWVGAFDGLHIFSPKFEHLGHYTLSDEKLPASDIYQLSPNEILVASNIGNVWLFKTNEGKVVSKSKYNVPFQNVSCLLKDSKKNIWFGTLGCGLWKMDSLGHATEIIPLGNPNALQKTHSIYEDKNGDIWVGTQVNGLFRLRAKKSVGIIHSSDLGLPEIDISCFEENSDGDIYVGSDGYGLNKIDKNGIYLNKVGETSTLIGDNIISLCKEGNSVLFCSWTKGLGKIDNKGRISHIKYNDIERPLNSSKKVVQMKDGELWVAVQGDCIYRRLNSGKWTKFILRVGDAIDNWVNDIEETNDGSKWVTTACGVWLIKGESMKYFSCKDTSGLYINIEDGVCDSLGNFLFIKNDSIEVIKIANGERYKLDFLPKIKYASIFFDKNGNLWSGCSKGILSIDLKEKTYTTITIPEAKYGKPQFLPRSTFESSRGKIFFGCTSGFVTFTPDVRKDKANVLYLAWDYIENEDGKSQIENSLKIDYNKTRLKVGFDILTSNGIDNLIRKYRLSGFDNNWYEIEGENDIEFNFIPAGNYTLEVETYYIGSESNKKSITLPITILPPWWATWWFRLLSFIILLATIAAIVQARFLAMKRRQTQLEKMVKERTADLYSSIKDKDRIVSVVAHDLKNNIFSIVCGLEMLNGNIGLSIDSKNSRILGAIFNSSKKLQNQMLQLLDWATNQSNIKFSPTNVDIETLVNDSVSILTGIINEKKIEIVKTFDIDKLVYCDVRMISSTIRNLVNNAIKFTPKNGKIEIKATKDNSMARIDIIDNGVGMDSEQVEALLKGQGVSTSGTENEQGTGFGFKISTEFIQQNGGNISIESKKNEGTKISFTIPLSDHEKGDEEEETSTQDAEPNVSNGEAQVLAIDKTLLEGNTVLIVDDDPILRSNIHTLLDPYMTVVEAEDGVEGLSVTLKSMPDIIISDVDMPNKNGLELAEDIRTNKSTHHIPFLFISANNSDADRVNGLSYGAIDYISKPFKNNELLLKINNILALRRTQQLSLYMGTCPKEEGAKLSINPMLKQLLDIIEANYENPDFSVEDLAKAMTISKSTLIRKLKSLADKTPVEMLSEYRLKKADEFLRTQNLPVKEVAFMTGFNDPYYFSRKYKEYFGYAPTQRDNV